MAEILEARAKIISCVGGKYTVAFPSCEGGRTVGNLAAKGAFRHERIKPLPGDDVILRDDGTGYFITGICGRKNSLIRPPLANLDVLYIVTSCRTPAPVPGFADKITVICEKNNISPVIIVTKSELDPDLADRITSVYRACGYKAFSTSVEKSDGVDALREFIDGKRGTVSAFCGASGVGKSTLMNALFPELPFRCEVGDVSRRIERGKNTTRTVMLYRTAPDTYVADTPGFSMLDFERFDLCDKDELPYMFPEFSRYLCRCKYTKCSHTKEDGCLIREAVSRGEIPESRYASYLSLYEDVKNKKEWEK